MPFDKGRAAGWSAPTRAHAKDRPRLAWFATSLTDHDRPFLLIPLCLATGITGYFLSVDAAVLPMVAIVCLAASLATGGGSDRRYIALLLAIAGVIAGTGAFAAYLADLRQAKPVLQDRVGPIDVTASITRIDPRGDTGAVISVRVLGSERAPGLVGLRFRMTSGPDFDHLPETGDQVAMRAMFFASPKAIVPGGYDPTFWRYFAGYSGGGRVLGAPLPIDIAPGLRNDVPVLRTLSEKARHAVRDAVRAAMPNETAGVATTLLTGLRGDIEEGVRDALRRSGLAHILAISGLHMTLVAGGVFVAARLGLMLIGGSAMAGSAKRVAAMIAIGAASIYFAISGGAVSAQRSYLMIVVMFLAVTLVRPAITLRNVAIAATAILLFEPHFLFSAGFQMSFAATALLVAGYERMRQAEMRRLFGRQTGTFGGIVRTGVLLLGGTALTSILAGAATAPFAAYHFNQAVPYGLLANIVAMPIFSFVVMPAATVSLIAVPFGLEVAPLWVLDQGLTAVIWVADAVANLDGAYIGIDQISGFSLSALALAGFVAISLKRPPLLLIVGLLGLAAIFHDRTQADIFISESRASAAYFANDRGLVALSPRIHGFAAERWAQSRGERPSGNGDAAPSRAACDRRGCAIQTEGGHWISYVSSVRDVAEACALSDIVISRMAVPKRIADSCGDTVLLPKADQSGTQAFALKFDPRDGRPIAQPIETPQLRHMSRPLDPFAPSMRSEH